MRTKVLPSLFELIKEEKLRIYRKAKKNSDKDYITKLCLEGMLEGTRSKGRPKRRWTDELKS